MRAHNIFELLKKTLFKQTSVPTSNTQTIHNFWFTFLQTAKFISKSENKIKRGYQQQIRLSQYYEFQY
jgi:hypothetical protein